MIPILVLLTIAAFIALDYFVFRPRRRPVPALQAPFEMRVFPPGLFMAPGHTWLQVEPEGTVKLGADRFPGALLEHVDRVELRAAGSEVHEGDPVARLRHDGRTLDLRSPVEGLVEAVNEGVTRSPDDVRDDPFGDGWLLRITPRNLAHALRRMFVAEEADLWTRGELARLRAWLTESTRSGEPAAALPDGGLPVVGLVDHLDEVAWDELVRHFFDIPAARDGVRAER